MNAVVAASSAMVDLLAARRSVPPHQLAEPAPDDATLSRILTVAARVPDHGKLAPWRFIVIRGGARERVGERLADIVLADDPDADAKRIDVERHRLTRAPLVVAVVSRAQPHPKIPEWEQMLSAGAVCFNLCVAANAHGYGSSWLTEWMAYDRRALDALGLDPQERLAGFVHIGTALERPADRVRPDMNAIVSYLPEA